MADLEKNSKDSDTKFRLLKAAALLFAKKGFHGVSVKDIAEKAGANIALVSYHFGGKQGLYDSCFDQFISEWTAFLDTKILRPTSYEDFRFRFRLFVEKMIDDNLENPEACAIMKHELENEESESSVIARKTMARFFDVVGGFIKSAQKQKYLRDDIDHNDVCCIFFGGIQHAMRSASMRTKVLGEDMREPKTRDRFISSAMELFFNGLDAKKKN